MDMNPKKELKEAENKLTELQNRLKSLMQIVWGSKNVDSKDVINAVKELQSLCEWAAQKQDVWSQDARLFLQLQGLQNIQKSLEDASTNVEKTKPSPDPDNPKNQPPDEISNSKELPPSDVNSHEKHLEENDFVTLDRQSHFESSSVTRGVEKISHEDDRLVFDSEKIKFSNTTDDSNNSEPVHKFKEDDVLNFLTDGIETLLKSNEEMKEFLASSSGNQTESSATSSTIGIMQSPCSDIPDLLSNDIDDFEDNFDLNVMNFASKPVSEMCAALLDDIEKNVKSEIAVESPQPNDLKLLTDSEIFASKDTDATESRTKLIKWDTKNDLLDLIQNDNLTQTERDYKDVWLNNLDLLTQPESDMQNISNSEQQNNVVSNLDLQGQYSAEIQDLVLPDSYNMFYNDSQIQNLNFTNSEKLTATNTETKSPVPPEKVADSGLTDSLKNDDNVSKLSIEEEDRCRSPYLLKSIGNEVMLLETTADDKATEIVSDPKITKDPLDICMFAIRNLYDNLRAKENELLKMSVIKNDQKHIEALQTVILDFHKEITSLNSRLDKADKENSSLKEQVLELEEAENDARSKAQKLEQKLVFLQEKNMHTQNEICQLKNNLRIASEKLSEKERTVKELRSQVAHMDNLVRKCEDQVKELKERDNNRQTEAANVEKVPSFDRGTQTYPLLAKIDRNVFTSNDSPSNGASLTEDTNQESQGTQSKINVSDQEQKEVSSRDVTNAEDQYVITIQDGELLKEFNNRLLTLMHDDTNLQEQIHNVDQINLTLWKKLQILENNIDECKRKNSDEPELLQNVEKDFENSSSDSKQEMMSPSLQTSIPADYLDGKESKVQQSQPLEDTEEETSFDKGYKIIEKTEHVHKEWKETEKQILSDFQQLACQKNELVQKIEKLVTEKDKFEQQVSRQQSELNELKEKNRKDVSKLRAEQENICATLQHKVNQLILDEKDLLKMIKNLKSERGNKTQTEGELERLKCSYIQLQLELSHSREEKRKLEQSYKARIDVVINKHKEQESHLINELDRLRQEKTKCDETIRDYQLKQQQLASALDEKDRELRRARESYEKSLAEIKLRHQSAETELKSEMMKLEEKALLATSAIMEGRLKVENELQEDIKQLRAKEESYLHKINELEKNMIKLQEDLTKVTQISDRNNEEAAIHGARANQMCDKDIKFPHATNISVPKSNILLDRYMDARPIPEAESKQFSRETERFVTPASATRQQQLPPASNKIMTVKEENVEDLRSQVRELQAQLDKISEEGVEVSPPSASPARPVSYAGWQKEEVLDYAEADTRSKEWRKSYTQGANSYPRSASQQDRPVHENRYLSRYRYKSGKEKQQAERNTVEENDYDEILPRPTDFHLVQQVGPDALLVGWSYVNCSFLEGFEIYLDNRLHERIYIPDRTKALISGLDLRNSFTLSIRAVSRYGQSSEQATLELTCQQQTKPELLEEEEDEYSDTESSRHRPYSMEW